MLHFLYTSEVKRISRNSYLAIGSELSATSPTQYLSPTNTGTDSNIFCALEHMLEDLKAISEHFN